MDFMYIILLWKTQGKTVQNVKLFNLDFPWFTYQNIIRLTLKLNYL